MEFTVSAAHEKRMKDQRLEEKPITKTRKDESTKKERRSGRKIGMLDCWSSEKT
jgi:hypothetical protein